jgi:hypothetical protein
MRQLSGENLTFGRRGQFSSGSFLVGSERSCAPFDDRFAPRDSTLPNLLDNSRLLSEFAIQYRPFRERAADHQ